MLIYTVVWRQSANPSLKAFNMQSEVKLPPPLAKSKAKSCSAVFHGDSCVLISHKLQRQLNFVMRKGELTLGRRAVPSVSSLLWMGHTESSRCIKGIIINHYNFHRYDHLVKMSLHHCFNEIYTFLTEEIESTTSHAAAPRHFRYERSGVNVHQVPSIFPFPSISVFVLAVASQLARKETVTQSKTHRRQTDAERVTASLSFSGVCLRLPSDGAARRSPLQIKHFLHETRNPNGLPYFLPSFPPTKLERNLDPGLPGPPRQFFPLRSSPFLSLPTPTLKFRDFPFFRS